MWSGVYALCKTTNWLSQPGLLRWSSHMESSLRGPPLWSCCTPAQLQRCSYRCHGHLPSLLPGRQSPGNDPNNKNKTRGLDPTGHYQPLATALATLAQAVYTVSTDICMYCTVRMYVHWNLSIVDTIGNLGPCWLSSIERYTVTALCGWDCRVSLLDRCPWFRVSFIERFHCTCVHTSTVYFPTRLQCYVRNCMHSNSHCH